MSFCNEQEIQIADNDKLYFISYAVVHWIDVFVRRDYKDIIISSWQHCQKEKGLEIYAWCIMTSHVHMIIGSSQEKMDAIVGGMKSYTSTKMREAISTYVGKPERMDGMDDGTGREEEQQQRQLAVLAAAQQAVTDLGQGDVPPKDGLHPQQSGGSGFRGEGRGLPLQQCSGFLWNERVN